MSVVLTDEEAVALAGYIASLIDPDNPAEPNDKQREAIAKLEAVTTNIG